MNIKIDGDAEFNISEKYREVIVSFLASLGVRLIDQLEKDV